MSNTIKENLIKITPSEVCMYPKCGGCLKEGSRGLCMKHASKARRMIKSGETTWEELEEKGLARKKFTNNEISARMKKYPPNYRRYIPGVDHAKTH